MVEAQLWSLKPTRKTGRTAKKLELVAAVGVGPWAESLEVYFSPGLRFTDSCLGRYSDSYSVCSSPEGLRVAEPA